MPDSRVARAAADRKRAGAFSNGRDWRAFLAAVQTPAAYATVATALEAGHAWFTGHAGVADKGTENESCSWLLEESGLMAHKTLGV
jgi:hypothetical protein